MGTVLQQRHAMHCLTVLSFLFPCVRSVSRVDQMTLVDSTTVTMTACFDFSGRHRLKCIPLSRHRITLYSQSDFGSESASFQTFILGGARVFFIPLFPFLKKSSCIPKKLLAWFHDGQKIAFQGRILAPSLSTKWFLVSDRHPDSHL